ncbi:MAG: hypothetical protein ACNYPI_04755 [Arenicellales bacterium WSBS_2016_MAG_OTU3]
MRIASAVKTVARRDSLALAVTIILAWLLLSATKQVFAQTLSTDLLTARDWPQYRSGLAVLDLPPLRKMMKVYLANDNALISVRYPGGDAGSAWAGELREWLVSLGVPLGDIELLPGSRARDALTLEVFRNPGRITKPSAQTDIKEENES